MTATVADLLLSTAGCNALTLWQPWASAVAELGKDVENREKWGPPATAVGKALAIHAGLTYDVPGAASIQEVLRLKPPGRQSCVKGAVVAVAVLLGCVKDSRSKRARPGDFHWLLGGTVRLAKPVPCKGAQGLWRLPPAVLEEVRRQVREATSPPAFRVEEPEARRASIRVVSKGSGRGVGPAVRTDVVYVERNSTRIIVCEKCRSSRYDTGGTHAARIMRNPPPGWPTCQHGYPVLADCAWEPTDLTMCAWHTREGSAP